MKLCLVGDAFPPMRTSAAVQLRDLAREFARQGHDLTVITPVEELKEPYFLESLDGFQVLRIRAVRTKNVGYIRRAFGELITPFVMLKNIKKNSSIKNKRWDGVIWYSPSIFHGPLIASMKIKNGGKRYLIIRDIFPQWAVDMGLMRRGLTYRFFDLVARYQYSLADIIGVQSPGNLLYFEDWEKKFNRSVEVLQNWLDESTVTKCTLRVDSTKLAGRKIFVYAGNMGIAQNMDILLDLAVAMRSEPAVGFLFVGRGSDLEKLISRSEKMELDNVLFASEIDPNEIPDLYRQCSVGLISLDCRHTTHNIPGKFLSYMRSGMPILANINAGNDLIKTIRTERVGEVSDLNNINDLLLLAKKIILQIDEDPNLSNRCRTLFERDFTAKKAAKQIIEALKA